jgi:hypothetical protein
MAFSPQQHTSLLRDGLDFVPESDFRYLPINVRLKLVELEKTNGQVYLPKNEAASLKREVAAEKMSEVAKRNDPDAYFGGDPEYSSTPITDDPAELKGRLGTDEYGTRPTIYRAIEPEGAVFNNRYLTSGQYESQYKESDPTIYGRYTPTKKGDEILLPPTASWLNPFADRINETEPHEYMHRGMMPTNWLSKYLLGPIDSISEKVGVGNLFGTRVFAGNQHTYIAKALAEDKQKKQMADFERQTSKLSERELATLKKYLESERNKLQLEKNRIKKATGGEANNLQAALDMLNNPVTSSISPLGDPTLSPLMESLQKNPIDDFAMMMANPVKKVTSAARLAQLANPTNEVFKTATKKEIVDYIQTIPLKERLALRANDSIPLKGKYAILDSDKIDFYKDIVDLGKLPKNFKAGDNTLAKIYMEKNNIPSRVDITEPLAGFKPRPYFEEIIDFKKGTEKIKLSFPKTGVLQPYGAQTAYRTKTLTNPSKEQLDKLFKGMREKDLQKQLDGLRKAKSIESDPGSTLGDLAEAAKLRRSMPYKTSDDIAKELLELQGVEKLDTDLLAILKKQYNL